MEAFTRLNNQQKLAGIVVIALFLAIMVGSFLWAREPAYAVLFSIQDEKDGGQIVAALQQQNIPYHFSEGGHTILVPQNVVHDTRLRLAAQGLPKGGLVGFELLENQKMGISQFAEQVNYQRGLEGELARSVQSLAAVKGARVHLGIPKQTAFLRDEQKTSASVLVSLYPGRTLESAQVAGIVNLVASSVPQLNPLNVTVIDQEGRLISQSQDALRNAGLDPSQLKYVREIEANYTKRIEDILSPVVGASNVRAQVAADIDFSQIDQVAETYKPNPSPENAIRSQQTIENSSGAPAAAGIPGALSNQPPVPATAPLSQPPVAGSASGTSNGNGNAQNYSKNTSTNYEVDKTIRHTKSVPGTVRRLSVAIVVNHKKELAKDPAKSKSLPLTEAEMKQLTELARESVGFNKERGDTLNVANAPFTPIEKDIIPDAPFWADAELIATLKETAKYLLFAGLMFWLWTRLLKPMLGKLMETASSPRSNPATSTEAGGTSHTPQVIYETKLAAARDLAKKDPKVVASIVKGWVDGGERAK